MSCGYYIVTTDTDMVFALGKNVDHDFKRKVFSCHLCQTCFGLKPLFEVHSFSSFKQLNLLLTANVFEFSIEDEYGSKIGVSDFLDMIQEENNSGKSRLSEDGVFADAEGFEWLDCIFE